MPRVQMSLILAVTGLAGFLASFALLHAGLARMWLRYPVSVLFAYAVFLLLLRLWLFYQGRAIRVPDFDLYGLENLSTPDFGGGAGGDCGFGGGGDFGGGGAGGSWGEGLHSASAPGGSGGGGGLLDSLDVGDADAGCLFVLALALIVGGVVASLYVIYAAPALLAEILVEGVLVTGLYRSMKKAGGGNWLGAAFRRTWIPVVLTLLLFAAAGYFLQAAAPKARTIGEAWQSLRAD
jgi:FtsH-binding integral membrane protein